MGEFKMALNRWPAEVKARLRKAPQPSWIAPMLATLTEERFSSDEWLFEPKLGRRTLSHPIEYADFEGVIPETQYGAGTVMVWDKRTYEPQDDISPDKQLAQGKIDVSCSAQSCGSASP